VVGNEVWFVDQKGQVRRAYQTDFDTFRRDIVGTNISPYLTSLSTAQLAKICMTTFDDKVFIAIPDPASPVNNLVLVYDILAARVNEDQQAWTLYQGVGWTPTQFTVMDITGETNLYFSNNSNQIVTLTDSGGDQGQQVTATIETKRHNYKRPELFKRSKWGYLSGASQTGSKINLYVSQGGLPYAKLDQIKDVRTQIISDSFDLSGHGSPLNDSTQILNDNFNLLDNAERQCRFLYDNPAYINETDKSIQHKFEYSGFSRPTLYGYTSHFELRPLT
jgi:hypothetical protein